MTMEYKAGHYFKRLTMIDMAFGDADHHLRELAKAGGLELIAGGPRRYFSASAPALATMPS